MDYAIPPHKVEANGFIHARTDALQSMYAHFGIEPRFSKAVTTGHGVNPELHPQLQVCFDCAVGHAFGEIVQAVTLLHEMFLLR